jgi:hypothetical protein
MSDVGKHRTPWSSAEIEQLESMWSKQNLKDIALKLGRTEKAIEAKALAIQRQRNPSRGKHYQRRNSGASFFLS